MPERQTLRRVQQDEREGKAASTQAGEFIREEIHHVREGKHGARSAKHAIAIGLSKARRAVRASKQALKRESVAAGSHRALAKQSRAAARQRSPGERPEAAIKGASTRSAAKRGGAHSRIGRSA